MSHLTMPDPHPGRCRNYRTVTHGNGQVESLRCLDYEATVHVCSFPEPMLTPSQSWAEGFNVYSPPKPKPWVKPVDVSGRSVDS